MHRETPVFLFLALALLIGLASYTNAQTIFGTILGTTTDPSGAVVPGVKIRVINVGTGFEREANSDALGNYEVTALPPGRYRVEAEHSGFQRLVREGIELQTRQVARVDLALAVGDVTTTVSVTDAPPIVESETARIADVRSGDNIRALPLSTVSPFRYFVLTPGVLGNVTGSLFSFNGSWLKESHWAVDGATVSTGYGGEQMAIIVNNMETFQEVKIDLANNSAESGALGTVTLVTRSGQNELHGSLFHTYISPGLRATNPFTFLKSRTVTNQYGGSVGGPVWIPKVYNGRNRTFFFFSYLDWRDSARATDITPTVPLSAWQRGDFSDLLRMSSPVQLRDPFTGLPLAGNLVPATRISSVADKIQKRFYPAPNFGDPNVFAVQNYRAQMRPPARNPYKRSVRIDHKISDSNTIFGRINLENAHGDGWLGSLPTMGQNKQIRSGQHFALVDTHVFNPRVVNEFRISIPRDLNNFYERCFPGLPFVTEFGIQGLAPNLPADAGGLPRVRFSGVGSVQNLDVGAGSKPLDFTVQFYEQLSWYRGRHSLKFGAQLLKIKFENLSVPATLFGDWLFTTRYSGWAYADFLMGVPSEATRDHPNPKIHQKRTALDFFVQDDIRVNPRLTLNLGARYEYHPPWYEVNNLMANFDVARQSLVVPAGASQKISPLFTAVFPKVKVIEATQAGVPARSMAQTDVNNIAPRFGIAYRPFGHARSVVRAGYGIFFNVTPLHPSAGGSPFKLSEPTFVNPTGRPELVWPQAYPAAGVTPSAVAFPSFSVIDPWFSTPYSQQWNLTLEQQFATTGIRLSYIGTTGKSIDYALNVNAPAPNSTPYIQKVRPLTDYAAITVTQNGATHTYHAMQLEVQRQMSNGLSYQVGYTWAKDVGDHHLSVENPFDRRAGRSAVSRVPTQRLTGNWVWELPIGKGKPLLSGISGLAQGIAGGWQLSGIVSLQTGDRLTPTYSAPDIHTNIAHTTSLTPPTVTRRPDRIADGNLPPDQRTVTRWFNTAAFKDPGCPDATPFCTGAARTSVGRFGNSGANIIYGPGSALVHAGLFKYFQIQERVKLRLEFSGTNLFNRKNWSNPSMDLSNPLAVGRISAVGGGAAAGSWDVPGPREMRFVWRLEF